MQERARCKWYAEKYWQRVSIKSNKQNLHSNYSYIISDFAFARHAQPARMREHECRYAAELISDYQSYILFFIKARERCKRNESYQKMNRMFQLSGRHRIMGKPAFSAALVMTVLEVEDIVSTCTRNRQPSGLINSSDDLSWRSSVREKRRTKEYNDNIVVRFVRLKQHGPCNGLSCLSPLRKAGICFAKAR